jgi:hypothetical protein
MRLNSCVCRRVDLSTSRSPKVIWDRPSSRRTSGTRSTTSKVCGQGGGKTTKLNRGRRSPETRVNRSVTPEKLLREFQNESLNSRSMDSQRAEVNLYHLII